MLHKLQNLNMAPKMAKQPLELVKFKNYTIEANNQKLKSIQLTEKSPTLSLKHGTLLISTDTPDLSRDHAE